MGNVASLRTYATQDQGYSDLELSLHQKCLEIFPDRCFCKDNFSCKITNNDRKNIESFATIEIKSGNIKSYYENYTITVYIDFVAIQHSYFKEGYGEHLNTFPYLNKLLGQHVSDTENILKIINQYFVMIDDLNKKSIR